VNPRRAVVHNDLLGHLVRADPWVEQGQSSYSRAHDSIRSADFAAAEDYGRITIQEAQEAYDLFSAWLGEIPQILSAKGVPPDVVAQRLDVDLDVGWRTYLDLIDEFAKACRRRDAESAPDILERARIVWQRHHDCACDAICALLDFAARQLGESFVGDLWDVLLSDMYERAAHIYNLDTMPWGQSVERLLLDIFEATRGHLTGPARDGSFSITEETDRWIITFAPCGSGGQTFESVAGTPMSDHGRLKRDHSVTTGEHDWAWNTKGVCLYCAHCCQLQQRAPIERLGFPLRVIDPPTRQQKSATCTWSIYKDRRAIPDHAYTRVGFDPPDRSQN
jgi:hypothetical protein